MNEKSCCFADQTYRVLDFLAPLAVVLSKGSLNIYQGKIATFTTNMTTVPES